MCSEFQTEKIFFGDTLTFLQSANSKAHTLIFFELCTILSIWES